MKAAVPIKIIVADDPRNPPGAKKVARTFHLKVPHNCELGDIKQILLQKYPILQYMISVLYYINSGN